MPGVIEPLLIGLAVKVVRKRTPNWSGWERMDAAFEGVKARIRPTRSEDVPPPCCLSYRTPRCRCDA